jgi:RNA polymerase sporulation-specific sigma factor
MTTRRRTPTDDASDVELVAAVQAGDGAAFDRLVARHKGFLRSRGRGYFLMGGDREDLEQEALIGFYKAARDFQPARQVSFRAFAELCITRQMITAIKAANRKKHQPLNHSRSLTIAVDDDPDGEVREIAVPDVDADPLFQVVAAEETSATRQVLHETLSPLEVDVLTRYVAGASYETIAEEVGRHAKAVDNALQRVKRKLGPQLAPLLVA